MQITGLIPSESGTLSDWRNYVHEDDKELVNLQWELLLKDPTASVAMEFRYIPPVKDAEMIWIVMQAKPELASAPATKHGHQRSTTPPQPARPQGSSSPESAAPQQEHQQAPTETSSERHAAAATAAAPPSLQQQQTNESTLQNNPNNHLHNPDDETNNHATNDHHSITIVPYLGNPSLAQNVQNHNSSSRSDNTNRESRRNNKINKIKDEIKDRIRLKLKRHKINSKKTEKVAKEKLPTS